MEPRTIAAPFRLDYRRMKSTVDFLLALGLLLVTWPFILLGMIAVRATSPGPPLYFQKRLGHRGRTITICKIRTMYQDCERKTGAVWSVPGDPRVTLVGRLLRWSHIDELPQLYNVLCGEMSLVGPRPERPEIVGQIERVLPDYRRRLEVRPGLTGLAQILQAPDTDVESVRRKLAMDLYYIDQFGASIDFRVLVATPLHLVRFPSRRIARLFGLSLEEIDRPIILGVGEAGPDGVHVEASCAG